MFTPTTGGPPGRSECISLHCGERPTPKHRRGLAWEGGLGAEKVRGGGREWSLWEMGVKSHGGCEAESVFQPSAHLTFLP